MPLIIDEFKHRAAAVNLSFNELCRRAGIARSTFQRWTAGTVKPTIENLERIDSVLRRAEIEKNAPV